MKKSLSEELLPTLDELYLNLAEKSLYQFGKQAWSQIEPDPFSGNWHIEAICEHLEATVKGEIPNLIINVPPRHTKSLTVSVLFPAWQWGPNNHPETRWVFTSYASDLSIRDSVKCRTLLQSQWYQSRWGSRFQLTGDQNAKERYNTNKRGFRIATSVGGLGTGEGGDFLVVDDPHNLKDTSDGSRDNVIQWWSQSMVTRFNDPKKHHKIIIMQRSHANDLVGWIKDNSADRYEFLILPAEYEPKFHCSTGIGWSDPRTDTGELLWKERFTKKSLEDLSRDMGSYAYAAQFQQRPSPAEGGILKRHWWKFYKETPSEIAESCEFLIQSWDMAFKDTKTSSYVVGQVWGVRKAEFFLIDQVRDKLSFTQTKTAVKNLSGKWPLATAKYIEEKANGAAIIDDLRTTVNGMIPVNPTDSKEARAFAISPLIEAGNVYLPEVSKFAWVDDFIEECAQFPSGANNDMVDAMSQGLLKAKKKVRTLTNVASLESLTRAAPWSSMSVR